VLIAARWCQCSVLAWVLVLVKTQHQSSNLYQFERAATSNQRQFPCSPNGPGSFFVKVGWSFDKHILFNF
jgi:hypothetical protein